MVLEETVGYQRQCVTASQPLWSKTEKMKALLYKGKKKVEVNTVPRPMITEPRDAIVHIEVSTICGSDLHLYHGVVSETEKSDILGHEACGRVVEVGSQVSNVKVGDRVSISAVIACGQCDFCKMGRFSNCDCTNPSKVQDSMYGGATAALFGYSHMTGGYPGLQSEYARVPLADVNLLILPESKVEADGGLSDEQAIMLSDVAPTAYQSALFSDIGSDEWHKTLVVYGCGPIGLAAGYFAKTLFKAEKVVMVDRVPDRLKLVHDHPSLRDLEFMTVDASQEKNPLQKCKELLGGKAPDCVIDATGFDYSKTFTHFIEQSLGFETDSIDGLTDCIKLVRKSGTVSIIGVYIGYANHFPIGAIMEKGLVLKSGQLHCQKHWAMLLEKMLNKEIDLKWLVSHVESFDKIGESYRIFDEKRHGMIKPIFKTSEPVGV
ncbi:hypothetical protein MIR68_000501 [Amoeboaphelidium protococcarum]|nr:hypothetical protein MIR68_000501 [Amoeboaphelidium protococcarum]